MTSYFEELWKLKSSFVQINSKTKYSHICLQADVEGLLKKCMLILARYFQPLAGVCCIVSQMVTRWANPLSSIQKQLYLQFGHRLRIASKTNFLQKIKKKIVYGVPRKYDKATKKSKMIFLFSLVYPK